MPLAVLCPRDNIVGLLSDDKHFVTVLSPNGAAQARICCRELWNALPGFNSHRREFD